MSIFVLSTFVQSINQPIKIKIKMFSDERIAQIAQMCHESNRVLCAMFDDFSQVPWEETSEQIKASAIAGVKYYLENRCTPEEQHAEWKRFKAEQGYVYGEVKDDVAKTHPCMVEYSELPVQQRVKDVIFQHTIDGYLKITGMH